MYINNMDPANARFVLYLLVSLCISILLYAFSNRTHNLPKGPPGIPFFGNIFDVRGGPLHFKLTKWATQYGDFFSYKIGRTPVIVLSSPEAINDLFVKRGQKYSSRPKASNQAALITQEARIVNMPYGDKWRVRLIMITMWIIMLIVYSGAQTSNPQSTRHADRKVLPPIPGVREQAHFEELT